MMDSPNNKLKPADDSMATDDFKVYEEGVLISALFKEKDRFVLLNIFDSLEENDFFH